MPKRAVFQRFRRGLSLDVSVGVDMVVEQSSLESQSRGCAKTPILTIDPSPSDHPTSSFHMRHDITFFCRLDQSTTEKYLAQKEA